jgi:hypothetical protein
MRTLLRISNISNINLLSDCGALKMTPEGPLVSLGATMPLSREIERLRAEHVALIALARIVTELLQAPGPSRLTELASARGLLRETLVRHLKCEDWILYPRLRATGDPNLMHITREFELEMGDLAAEYVAYDDKWTAERVAAKWTEFCRETIEVFGVLATRVEREERELYPLADKLYAAAAALGPAVMDEVPISS